MKFRQTRETTPTITLDEELKLDIATEIDSEKQVIVHIQINPLPFLNQIRIWPSTFLIDQHSAHKSQLLWAQHISIMPQWTFIPPFKESRFSLYFSALPKSCTRFNLHEDIPEPGGFHIQNIVRNTQDVYFLEMN